MKKITINFFVLMFLAGTSLSFAQTLNQSANWPNAGWTLSGSYTAAGLLADPAVDANFSFDDDAAGNPSTDNPISTSPVIDLTAASTAGETWITISGDIVYRQINSDVLVLEIYDADNMTWSTAETFSGNSTNADFQTCASVVPYTTAVINIAGYTATQLSGFQYRFSYDDLAGWQWGFCLSSPTITSATPPNCPDPASLSVSNVLPTSADLNWTDNGTAALWDIELLDITNGDVVSGTATSTGVLNPFTVTLVENNDYEFYVRADCGVDGTSGWAGPFAFSTPITPPVNDVLAGATPIIPSLEGTGCGTFNFVNSTGNDGTTDSGLDNACNTTDTGLDRFYTWTATSDALVWNDGAGNPGITIIDALTEVEITCEGTFAADDFILSGWTVGQDLIIQIYDFGGADVQTTFCLEEFMLPAAPDCASNPLPVSDAIDVAVGAITLTWDAPITGPTPTSYNLYSGIVSDGSDLGLVGNFTVTTADVNINGFDTTIYWQVRPLNGPAEAAGCPLWNFTTVSPPTGALCTDPLLVGTLPYNDAGDTAGFGDDYTGSPGATGCGTTSSYLNGDDVVYAYTATADGVIKLSMSGIGSTYSGIFVYTDCANIGTECVAGFGNGNSTADYSIDLPVTNGTTYYVVVSTWAAPQTTTYTLDITEVLCAEPSDLVAAITGLDTVDFTWIAGDLETEWSYEYGVSPYTQGGGGTSGTVMTTPSLSLSGLTPGETYDIYLQSNCASGDNSPYVTVSWTQPVVGAICETAIDIAALPYNTSDDTANYGDNYTGTAGATNCGTTSNYLNGDDVVYAYTATSDITINLAMSAISETYSGMFVYTDCANIGTECVAGFGNGNSTADYSLDIDVTSGTTYYIVVSTWASPQSTAFTLDITEECLADAGTLTADATPVTLSGGTATISATANGDIVVPTDYEVTYVLTSGATLIIEQAGATPSFDVTTAGDYTIHTLVAETSDNTDPNFLDLGVIVFGTTTGGDVLGIVGANNLCASLDVAGAPIMVMEECTADAGTLTADVTPVTIVAGTATISATANGDIVVPTDYDVTYVLTSGATLVIEQAGATPSFDVTTAGDYTIHTLVAETSDNTDPNFLDLGVIVFGTTTGGDVLGIVGANNLCASLDVAGAPITVDPELSIGDENFAGFTYFPNPVKNMLTLNAQNTIETVTMFNMLGQEVLTATPNALNSVLDMSRLESGAYFVKVSISNITQTIRVIKQ